MTKLYDALKPFLAFARLPSFANLPDDYRITPGSPMAAPQLTVGQFKALADAYPEPRKGLSYRPGETPLHPDLTHPYLDVINEGIKARDEIDTPNHRGSPYGGHSLEHCLHSTGWVQRDLRLALDKARAEAKPEHLPFGTQPDPRPKPVVWSLPPVQERPDSYQCLVWWRGRWRHVAWAKVHQMWMFGYGTPGISNELGLAFAPLPQEMDGDFWDPNVRQS